MLYTDLREAQEALTELLSKVQKGTYVSPSKQLYKDYVKKWLNEKWLKSKKKEDQTLSSYDSYFRNYVLPALGGLKLNEIAKTDIEKLVLDMSYDDFSAKTIRKTIVLVKATLEKAIDDGLIDNNAAKKVELPKVEEKEFSVWTQDQIEIFLDATKNDRLFTLFRLALMTGMRRGEILGLRWKDIRFDLNTVTIHQTLSSDGKTIMQGAKTRSSRRTINIDKTTMEALSVLKERVLEEKRRFGEGYPDYDLVFCTKYGTPLAPPNVRRTFKQISNEANLPPIRFHDLRHTHATLLFEKRIPIKVISERLGHSSINVTLNVYAHVLPHMQAEVVDLLDKTFS
ncbi:tyrosine-type recombinase/integrase [Bacillus atrophaeus]|uniref:tyrosine-type recombinase/integrase n=1 Tax=Bacillus atrophaeus TaxID=1452 RepID=UPI002D7EAFCB|nr:tyrosine-type recombinase/integrase [Bacillus atrophaeus]